MKKFKLNYKRKLLNLQKLPEVLERKKGRRMREEKKRPPDRERRLFLFQAVTG